MSKKTHRLVFIVAIAILLSNKLLAQSSPGIFINDWKAKTIENAQGVSKQQTTKTSSVIVNVNAQSIVNKVSKYLFGGNLNPYSSLFKKDTVLSLRNLKNMNPSVLRWPGGNLSNDYFWNAKTAADLPTDLPGTKYWHGSSLTTSDATTQDYYKTLKATNSTGCICVNYSYARYGKSNNSVQKAAHLAADWVRYDNGRTRFWEIGNENYGNWQSGYEIDPTLYTDGRPRFISGAIYGAHCKVFIDSMRVAAAQVGSEIFIGVQAWEDYTSWDPIQTNWNDGLFAQVGNKADFIILHNYYTPYQENSNINSIFKSLDNTSHFPQVIKSMVQKYGTKAYPLALTEYNIQCRDSGQLISYINGMHAAMVVGDAIKYGYGMAQRWSTVGFWGGSPGEMGTFSYNNEPGVPLGGMRPEFYYLYYLQKTMGDMMVSSTTNSAYVVSYATTFSSGQSGIMLLNKANTSRTTKVVIDNFSKGAKYHYYVLTGGTDNGTFSGNVLVNGQASPYIKGGPALSYEQIKPYTTTITGDIVIDIPAYGTVFLIIEGAEKPSFQSATIQNDASKLEVNLSMPITSALATKGFTIKANGNENISVSNISAHPTNSKALVLTLSRSITAIDKLTLSYYDGLLSSNGLSLNNFENKTVDNLLQGSSPQVSEAVTGSGNLIRIRFNKEMNTAVASGFTIKNLSKNRNVSVSSANFEAGNATSLLLQTTESFKFNDQLVVKYDGTLVKSNDNGILAPFETSVKNNLLAEAPVLDSIVIDKTGSTIKLYYDQLMVDADKHASFYTIYADLNRVSIGSTRTSANSVIIELPDGILNNQIIKLSYSGGTVKSSEGHLASDIVNFNVPNTVIGRPRFIQNVVINSTGATYELDLAEVGKKVFNDRSYLLTKLPDLLKSSEFIRWGNGLKSTYASPLLSFSVNVNGKVFVAHDNRLNKPTWLTSNFQRSSLTIEMDNVSIALYEKAVLSNTNIALGANQIQGAETTACNNYTVFFVSQDRLNMTNISTINTNNGNITVWPNPADDFTSINCGDFEFTQIDVLNVTGQVVKREYTSSTNSKSINISDLNNGIYFISVSNKKQKSTARILVSHKK